MASPAETHTEDRETPGLGPVIRAAWPLLLSIFLLMVGAGLQGTLLGVRAEAADFDATVTGVVLGLYYLGYLVGSSWVPTMIRSVGHIRVFTALVSLASAAVVVHGVWVQPVPWVLLRFTTGVCIAGLFVVSEAWLNDVASEGTRATLLAVYNTVITAGLATGSLLLNSADPSGFVLFVAGSVLLSVAAVPVALAPHEAPVPDASQPMTARSVVRSAPLGIVGAAMSGFGTGSALGFGAVYATRAGFGVSGASQFVAMVLVGAVLGGIPLGRWSDRTDRRLVMGTAGVLVAAGAALGITGTVMENLAVVLLAALLVGAGAFSLYGLSYAHMADYIEPTAMISAGSTLIMANGLGAATGPLLSSVMIAGAGPEAFFELIAVVSIAFTGYVVYRLIKRAAVSEDRRTHYVSVATGATTAVLDESVLSETLGVEPEELRPKRRRLRRPGRPRLRD